MDSDRLISELRAELQQKIRLEEDRLKEMRAISRALRRLDTISQRLEVAYSGHAGMADALREIAEQFPLHIERLERIILVLSNPGNPAHKKATAELHRTIAAGHINSIKAQLVQQHENYNRLQEESALHAGSPPLQLTNQIIRVSQEIERLEAEMRTLRSLNDDPKN